MKVMKLNSKNNFEKGPQRGVNTGQNSQKISSLEAEILCLSLNTQRPLRSKYNQRLNLRRFNYVFKLPQLNFTNKEGFSTLAFSTDELR